MSFLEVLLPPGVDNQPSTLWWAAELDGQTLKPQTQCGRLLVNLSGSAPGSTGVAPGLRNADRHDRSRGPSHAARCLLASARRQRPVRRARRRCAVATGTAERLPITHSDSSLTRIDQRQNLDQLAVVKAVDFIARDHFFSNERVASLSPGFAQSDLAHYQGMAIPNSCGELKVGVDELNVFKRDGTAVICEVAGGAAWPSRQLA